MYLLQLVLLITSTSMYDELPYTTLRFERTRHCGKSKTVIACEATTRLVTMRIISEASG
jgi:hypothetical protein